MKVINIQRRIASNFQREITKFPWFLVENSIWISISEPGISNTQVNNSVLDQCPKLEISFWDIEKNFNYTNPENGVSEILRPPSDEDAEKIVDFILDNPNKNVIVNCKAGVSRSGAVAQFCEDILSYEWSRSHKNIAVPNMLLYRKMVNYYYGTLI